MDQVMADGNGNGECPPNTCYGEFLGDTPATPNYTGHLDESSSNGSMDAGFETQPDIKDPLITVKGSTSGVMEPNSGGFAPGVVDEYGDYFGNALKDVVDKNKISIYVFYKVQDGGFSLKYIDVINNSGGVVLVKQIRLLATSNGQCSSTCLEANDYGYYVKPGPSIRPTNWQHGFSPSVIAKSTATISLIPSGVPINQMNMFYPSQVISISISIVLPDKYGLIFNQITGTLNWR